MFVFFVKQKTAYEMRISDWSSDVCSSDLARTPRAEPMPASTDQTDITRWRSPLGKAVRAAASAAGERTAAEMPCRARPAISDTSSWARPHNAEEAVKTKIGRASCRERVCQYV